MLPIRPTPDTAVLSSGRYSHCSEERLGQVGESYAVGSPCLEDRHGVKRAIIVVHRVAADIAYDGVDCLSLQRGILCQVLSHLHDQRVVGLYAPRYRVHIVQNIFGKRIGWDGKRCARVENPFCRDL